MINQNRSMRLPILALTGIFLAGCAANQAIIQEAQASLSEDQFIEDVVTLSDDSYEGRKVGMPGGERAMEYIVGRAKDIGLEPGNGDIYLQQVPFVETKQSENSKIAVTGNGSTVDWMAGDQFVRQNRGITSANISSSGLVIVGYGAVDSTDWDQFGNIDFTGKTVLLFRADPGYLSSDTTWDVDGKPSIHAANARKIRLATERGAVASFMVWDSSLADRKTSFSRFKGFRAGPSTALDAGIEATADTFYSAYMGPEVARKLFADNGLDYDETVWAAMKQDFAPIELEYSFEIDMVTTTREFSSPNILGVLPGAKRPDEYVLYSAHYDHIGVDKKLEGDQIFNGAADNGTGIASLLALSKAFVDLEKRPDRSIIFLWDTAEESGLLGSKYWASHPTVPTAMTVADLNIDMLRAFGKTRDIILIGPGKSEIEEYAKKAAAKLGLYMLHDPWPEQNSYFRSDHVSFARKGIPALSTNTGIDLADGGMDAGLALMDQFRAERYHRVGDIVDETWQLDGIMDYLRMMFDVGYTLSNQTKWPNWYAADPFREVRDADKAAHSK